MINAWLPGLTRLKRSTRGRSCARPERKPGIFESLEARTLLTGPTVYTVDLTSGWGQGSGNSGDIVYVLYIAEENTNPAGSVVKFDPNVFGTPQTIELESTLFVDSMALPISIDGPGAGLLTITFNPNADDVNKGLFDVQQGAAVSLSGVTISGGAKEENPDGSVNFAGGINNAGTLAINACTISNNTGYDTGGGIDNSGTLAITGSTIKGNDCAGSLSIGSTDSGGGGGIYNIGSLTLKDTIVDQNTSGTVGGGGGIYNGFPGTLVVTACTVDDNTAYTQAGGIFSTGIETLTDTTISGNSGGSFGGGLVSAGEPSYDSAAKATVEDCTIAGNSAFEGAGIFTGVGGSLVNSTLLIVSCTITDNSATLQVGNEVFAGGGGICNGDSNAGGLFGMGPGSVTLEDTIVALNTNLLPSGKTFSDDIASQNAFSSSSSGNLIGAGNNATFLKYSFGLADGLNNGTNDNQVGVANPGLGPLASDGGPTQTISLEYGSPAIGAGVTLQDAGQATDERGPGFPRTTAGSIDVGAFQHQPFNPDQLVHGLDVYWGSEGVASISVVNNTNMLPAGRKNDLPWYGIDKLQISLSLPAVLIAADVMLTGAKGMNYGPVTVTGMGTTYTIMFARPITMADRVMLTIAIPGTEMFMGRLNVLPGDVMGNGVVNSRDLSIIKTEMKGGMMPSIFANIFGNGAVTSSEYKSARKFVGAKLPKLGGKAMKALVARTGGQRTPLCPKIADHRAGGEIPGARAVISLRSPHGLAAAGPTPWRRLRRTR
jgi:hypothetical protein